MAAAAREASHAPPYLRQAQQRAVLGWLDQAFRSRGRRRVTLAVGRDGIMVPIRNEEHYKEGGVATISVYDRRGRRLGTVYQAEMPQAKQVTLTEELTAFLHAVLAGWERPLPRLVYLTDAGHHPTTFFEEVLRPMKNPRRPGERQVCDIHASGAARARGRTAWRRSRFPP